MGTVARVTAVASVPSAHPSAAAAGAEGGAPGDRYTPAPCASTRSSRPWPAATPSACTPSHDRRPARGRDRVDIFYGNCTPDVADQGRPVVDLGRTDQGPLALYQSSIGSPVFDILATRAEPKLVNYHNITPARLLEEWEPARRLRGAPGPDPDGAPGPREPPGRRRLGLQRGASWSRSATPTRPSSRSSST